jgi:hypothetical protein
VELLSITSLSRSHAKANCASARSFPRLTTRGRNPSVPDVFLWALAPMKSAMMTTREMLTLLLLLSLLLL